MQGQSVVLGVPTWDSAVQRREEKKNQARAEREEESAKPFPQIQIIQYYFQASDTLSRAGSIGTIVGLDTDR